jgi:hypothetical protein
MIAKLSDLPTRTRMRPSGITRRDTRRAVRS